VTDETCRGLLPVIPELEGGIAIYETSGAPLWTRGELRTEAMAWARTLAAPKPGLVFLLCRNTPDTVAALLGALAAGHVAALLDADIAPAALQPLKEAFSPDFVVGPAGTEITGEQVGAIQADHAILLSTSGTTGSSKFVRLSAANLRANADQIAAALHIGPQDIAAAHLPLHYSYGLSVLTSHLRQGAAVFLWSGSIATPEFWAAARQARATHLPGVPFHYDFLARGDLERLLPASMRTLTQAGGPLSPRLQTRMHEKLEAIGGRFYVMYGQTEASPRISTLPHESLPAKLGSVGVAMAGGQLSVIDEHGDAAPAGAVGRILYQGPNVMMGYAQARADLGLGDVEGGRLETGDLGRLDEDGFLFLTGRVKRFAKLHGLRLGLDEVEGRFREAGEVAALDGGDRILLFTPQPGAVNAVVAAVADEYKIRSADFRVLEVADLPRKSSGKIDYAALEALR
jgi:acyl-CoA synthetase (AMP-forming)/AMP-acid ligase II